nr:hypothetical protein [Tanacetum cinerariifolium]
MKDKVSQEHVCEKDMPLNNNIGKQSGDFVEMPRKAVEQGMDDNVLDEIDNAKGKQVPNHVVKKGNFEFLVCKQVANPGVHELVYKGRPLKRKMVYMCYVLDHQVMQRVSVILSPRPFSSCLVYRPSHFSNKGIKHCKRWYWCDPELEIKWYRTQLYEMHLLLNPSQREELENELTRQEELAVFQVEFADMEGQMQQLMEELKKSQKNSCFWKSIAIVFGVVALFMFVMN